MKTKENAQLPSSPNPVHGSPIGQVVINRENLINAAMRKLPGLYLAPPKGKAVVEVGHRGAISVYSKGRGVRLQI